MAERIPAPSIGDSPLLSDVVAAAYTIPTERLEADGTLSWNSTTMVCAIVQAGDETGLGWTYAPAACANLVDDLLSPAIVGRPAFAIGDASRRMRVAARNAGLL